MQDSKFLLYKLFYCIIRLSELTTFMVFYGPQEALEFQNGEVLFKNLIAYLCGPGKLSLFRDSLRTRRSGDQIPVEARISETVQTGAGVHPASYTMGTGSFLGVKRPGRDVDHIPHLVPRLKKE